MFSGNNSDASLSPSSSTSSLTSLSAFANPIGIPLKSSVSPPSLTSSDISLSPATPRLLLSTPSAICAYPSWPNRNFLTLGSSSCVDNTVQGNSRISDEDLLDLAELDLTNDSGLSASGSSIPCISWTATKQPPLVLSSVPLVSSQEVARTKRRRKSSPLKRKKLVKGMSPIPEAPE